jgi:predicted nucleic acid-binding Zn ribbon protein
MEVMQKISDKPLARHAKCGGKLEKEWSRTGFQFKGTGWYVTDYAGKQSDAADGKEAKEAKESKADSSAEAKPAETKSTAAEPKGEAKTKGGKKTAGAPTSGGD